MLYRIRLDRNDRLCYGSAIRFDSIRFDAIDDVLQSTK